MIQKRLFHANPQAMAAFKRREPDGSTTTGRPLRSVALIAWSDIDACLLSVADFAGVFLSSWRQQ